MAKRNVYLNEYNIPLDNAVYLPLAAGMLQSFAHTLPAIRDAFEFQPFLFMRERPESILARYEDPAVAAFSVSIWNFNLSIEVARRVKQRYPDCLIIFGGAQVPFEAADFLERHSFVDITVRGEGEQTFADILLRLPESRDFSGIAGISFRDPASGACVRNREERSLPDDLDVYPSPYLEGAFDHLFKAYPAMHFQAIVETNRGCPFQCSYCSWGQGGLSKRFRFFGLERIRKIADWCAARKIAYVFCADSNFGMFKRDLEIARAFADAKARSGGYPEKFRVCYAKNAEETVFEIGTLLHSRDMEKGMTLSRQTNNATAAALVGRKNIRMDVFTALQKRYNSADIPVYTELILGLPGESYESFREGLEEIMTSGIRNQLFVYFCQVYPNTELAYPAYRRRHGLETIIAPLNEIHGAVRPASLIDELEEIVVATSTMSREAWQRAAVLSWTMQLFHGLKLGFHLLSYLADRYTVRHTDFLEHCMGLSSRRDTTGVLKDEIVRFFSIADDVLHSRARAQVLPGFGGIYWDVEEGACLRIVTEKQRFYDELFKICTDFLTARKKDFDPDEVGEVIAFQSLLMPGLQDPPGKALDLSWDLPGYFRALFLGERTPLVKMRTTVTIAGTRDYRGDRETFAREKILWGRKSNKILNAFSTGNDLPADAHHAVIRPRTEVTH